MQLALLKHRHWSISRRSSRLPIHLSRKTCSILCARKFSKKNNSSRQRPLSKIEWHRLHQHRTQCRLNWEIAFLQSSLIQTTRCSNKAWCATPMISTHYRKLGKKFDKAPTVVQRAATIDLIIRTKALKRSWGSWKKMTWLSLRKISAKSRRCVSQNWTRPVAAAANVKRTQVASIVKKRSWHVTKKLVRFLQ